MSAKQEMDMDLAEARHNYAGGNPEEIAKSLRIDWRREEDDAEDWTDRETVLETMIAAAIRIAVQEGISNV